METYIIPEHVRGDTCTGKVFTISKNGSPLDLTGASIMMDLRWNGERYLRLKTNPGTDEKSITITDAAGGKFRIDEQIIDIPGNVYDYDIEIVLAGGVKKTYVGGTWTVVEDVTHER